MSLVIDLIILGLVSEHPRHGYDILKEISSREIRNNIKVSDVAIYKALVRLEKDGCLNSAPEKDGKTPERKVFSITPKGKELLSDLVFELLSGKEPVRDEYLVAMEFAGVLPYHELLVCLEKRLESLVKIRDGLRSKLSVLGDIQSHIYNLIIEHEIELHDLEINWLGKLHDRLSADGSNKFLFDVEGGGHPR